MEVNMYICVWVCECVWICVFVCHFYFIFYFSINTTALIVVFMDYSRFARYCLLAMYFQCILSVCYLCATSVAMMCHFSFSSFVDTLFWKWQYIWSVLIVSTLFFILKFSSVNQNENKDQCYCFDYNRRNKFQPNLFHPKHSNGFNC